MVFSQRLQDSLAQKQREDLYRTRASLQSAQGPVVQLAGREYLNFCSNDYLGLAAHPRLIERFSAAASRHGVGSGASHLVCGHSALHEELEAALAAFTGRERAVLFSSGYMANIGVLTTLLQRGDCVFEDRLNHASLLDGGLFSGARFKRFAHNDVSDLQHKLERATAPSLVVVDGVFSMDGDQAPVVELAQVCAAQNAWLMVDDAHGFGVFGENGAGTLEQAGLGETDVPVLMATLGKALGTAGAFVAGPAVLVDALIQSARNYIYTTASPPAVAAATLEALAILREEPGRRAHLHALIERFRQGAQQLQLPLMDSISPIQPLLVGEPGAALALSEKLRARGVLVGAIRPPTVPAGTARLRITLSAAHSAAQVDTLLDCLADCGQG
ncbi:MAG: 8-amino-7-oxononanoate synthase [Halioglobus sp.]